MTTFTFTNKETYLAYRSNWKAEYKQLSQQIRDYKFMNWFMSLRLPERITPQNQARFDKLKAQYGSRFYYIEPLKAKARQMLEERKASKVEAQRQYLAAHSQELVMA